MMQPLINNNKKYVKHSFRFTSMQYGAFYGGPIINTIFVTANAIYLKAKPWKIILILLNGLLFSATYIYLFFQHNTALDYSFMLASGLIIYSLYKNLCKLEIRVFSYMYSGKRYSTRRLYLLGPILQILLLHLVK